MDSKKYVFCNGDVTIEYFRGIPQITVPLPSRKEKCRFTLKPLTNNVGDFLEMMKKEDRGIDRISCLTESGVRIASSNSIESLFEEKFKLIVNDREYEIDPPKQLRLTQEELTNLSQVKIIVNQLYEALNVQDHQLSMEKEIIKKMELVQQDLMPMERHRHILNLQADTSTSYMVWLGLGLMGVQFGVLARLTWWEYSWDIMEPVTYFVTYGTTMMCYAYYVLTKQDSAMPEVRDRQYLMSFHKKAKKAGFDVDKYNRLKNEIFKLETDLKQLRDPLQLHLPHKGNYPGEHKPEAAIAEMHKAVTGSAPSKDIATGGGDGDGEGDKKK